MEGVARIGAPFKQEEGTPVAKIPPHNPGLIAIRAPVSDEDDKRSITSEEEEPEFGTPVGTPTARSTVGERNGRGRPAEDGIPAEEEGEEEEEEEEEGFCPVAKVREGSHSDSDSDSGSSSSSSKSFSASSSPPGLVRIVAKPSGDDDENPPHEELVDELEDQNEGFGLDRDLGFDSEEIGLRGEISLGVVSEGLKGSSVLIGEPKSSGFGETQGLGSFSPRESEVAEASVKGISLKGFGDMNGGDVDKSGGVVEGKKIRDFGIGKDVEGRDANVSKTDDGGLGIEFAGDEKEGGGREETEIDGTHDANSRVEKQPGELESAEISEPGSLHEPQEVHSQKAAEEWKSEVVDVQEVSAHKGEFVQPAENGSPKTAVAEVEAPKECEVDDSESYKEKSGEPSVGADAVDKVGVLKESSLIDHSSKDDGIRVFKGNEIDPRVDADDVDKVGDINESPLVDDSSKDDSNQVFKGNEIDPRVGADAVDKVGDIKESSLVDHSPKDDSNQVFKGNEIDPRVGADAVDKVGDIKESSLVDHSSKEDSTQVFKGNEIDPRKQNTHMADTNKTGDAINVHLPADVEFNLQVSTEEPENAQAMKTEDVQETRTEYSSENVEDSKQEAGPSQFDMQEFSVPREDSKAPENPAANVGIVREVHVDTAEPEASPSEEIRMPNAELANGNHSTQKVVADDNNDEDGETLGMSIAATSCAVIGSVNSCSVEENIQTLNANEFNDSQENANEVALPDAFIAQQSIDKEDNVETRNAINEHSLLVSEPNQCVATSEKQDDTQENEAADVHQTKTTENQGVKGLYSTMQETKLGSESQNSQNLEVSKEDLEFSQRKLSRSLESKEFIESKEPVINVDAGLEWNDDISKLESSAGELNTSNAGGIYESKTYFSTGEQDNEREVSDEEETVMPYANPQFKFESDSGDDSVQKVRQMMPDWDGEADDDEDDEEEEMDSSALAALMEAASSARVGTNNASFGEDDEEEEEMVDSSALAALMEAASSAVTGSNNASFGAAGSSVSTRPAGLGSSVPSLDPMPRFLHHTRANGSALSRPTPTEEDNEQNGDLHDGYDETQEKLQKIRVKFLRLVQRLGQTPQNVVVTQVLYRLGLAEGLKRGTGASRAFNPDRASTIAQELEAKNQEDLDFACNILVLGKTGVGKSATINSIFDEPKCVTNAFQPATHKVQEILGSVHGIKVRIVDTPGLMPSSAGQRRNKYIMLSIKKFIKKCPPDIILYFDRLDVQSRDFSDLPLLKLVTETFGAAIWFNTIVVFTHASSAPPEGANGTPLTYEMLVAQRSHIVQHSIRQAAGDMRLMNPVSLVENHSACRRNREGQRVLPNGQVWKPQLLLLCFASKVLAEANALLKLQDTTPGRPFGLRNRAPPLPFLLSSLLQSRAQLKAPDEQNGEDIDSDEDLEGLSDSEDEDEYDQLPPFKYLTKKKLSELTKEQKNAYLNEIDYREKLYQKKQWKEELRRRRQMKKKKKAQKAYEENMSDEEENPYAEAENPYNETDPVVMPDMALPPSFDSESPIHRYRYWDSANQWLVRPVLDTHGWDHDVGYDGVNLEKMIVLGGKIPASVSGQVTKDKKEANLQMECATSLKHGEYATTTAGFDVQTVGKGLAYTLRSESRFSNYKHNKTAGGLSLSYIGNALAAGMKLEDALMIGKRLKLVVNGGAMMGRGDVACGGSLEATMRDKDYPIGQTLTTLGISIMNWHGDLAIGGNLQSQFVVGRKTTMVTRANLNNRGSGQISIRTSSSEQLQIALIGLIPIIRSLISGRLFGPPDSTQ